MLSSNLSTRSLNNSKRFFTPIVASSLALFLSAGIANALDCSAVGGSGTDPKICFSFDQSDRNAPDNLQEATGLNTLSWSPSTTDGTNAVTPQAGGQPISQLIFGFKEGGPTPQGSAAAPSAYRVSFGGSGLKQVLVLDGGTKGIEMANQADGTTGKLEVYFGGAGADPTREFHLNLANSQGEFSFKGNILIQAGKGWPNPGAGASKFVGDFGKKVIGDITISTFPQEINQSGHRTELTFSSGADLEGNLTTEAGTTTATFADGNITGDVIADDVLGPFTYSTNNITFKGENNEIGGNVSVRTRGKNKPIGKNTITFQGNGTIKGSLSTSAQVTNSININTITFAKDGTIGGSITADLRGTNNITGSGDMNLKGNIAANMGGANTITMNGANNTIGGNITNNASTNTITATAGTLKIGSEASLASITASGGGKATNTITAKTLELNLSNLTVTGNGNSTNTNNITAESATINGNITANAGTNNITATTGVGTLTIGSASRTALIEASGGGTAKNTISAKDLTLNANVVSKIANGSSANTNSFVATNLILEGEKIEVSGAQGKTNGNAFTIKESATITATTIKATYGHNSITAKDLTLKTDLIYAHGSSSNVGITANNITATGTGNVEAATIKAESGINTFDLANGSLKASGDITAIRGHNNIAFTGADSTITAHGNIRAEGYGLNTLDATNGRIVIKSDASGSINISAEGYDTTAKVASTNSITAKTLEMNVASISATNGGNNTIEATGGSITTDNITAVMQPGLMEAISLL